MQSLQTHDRKYRKSRSIFALGLAFSLSAAALGSLDLGSSAEAAGAASISASPKVYVHGQAITFSGNIGVDGVRTVKLQSHMGRPGDSWSTVGRFSAKTDARGNFKFAYPAPAMFGIYFRVVAAGGHQTERLNFHPRVQETMLSFKSESANSASNTLVAGDRITVRANTSEYRKWGEVTTPPVIPGRQVLLQERTADFKWKTIGRDATDSNGIATFSIQSDSTGTKTYRARQGDYFVGANRIGWHPSFPFTVRYAASSARAEAIDARQATAGTLQARMAAPTPAPQAGGGGSRNASEVYKWGPQYYDFAWERGESLTSRPSKGTNARGAWEDVSTGSGRAVHHNGELFLQSKFEKKGPGDYGVTQATLRGNALKQGRWEFRLRTRVYESGATPFKFKVELVPARASALTCAPSAITVGEFITGKKGMKLGVRSQKANASWVKRVPRVSLTDSPRNWAVEVTNRHVTWFYEGRPLATSRVPAAQLGMELTPRMTIIGGKGQEMNATDIGSDWQRAWTLNKSRSNQSSAGLAKRAYRATC